MNASFIFSTDSFDLEIEIAANAVGDMHKMEAANALAKAKKLAKVKAFELLEKVCAQIDEQTFDDVFDVDEPEYGF